MRIDRNNQEERIARIDSMVARFRERSEQKSPRAPATAFRRQRSATSSRRQRSRKRR